MSVFIFYRSPSCFRKYKNFGPNISSFLCNSERGCHFISECGKTVCPLKAILQYSIESLVGFSAFDNMMFQHHGCSTCWLWWAGPINNITRLLEIIGGEMTCLYPYPCHDHATSTVQSSSKHHSLVNNFACKPTLPHICSDKQSCQNNEILLDIIISWPEVYNG